MLSVGRKEFVIRIQEAFCTNTRIVRKRLLYSRIFVVSLDRNVLKKQNSYLSPRGVTETLRETGRVAWEREFGSMYWIGDGRGGLEGIVSCSQSFAGQSRSEILEGIEVKPEKRLVLVAGRRYS